MVSLRAGCKLFILSYNQSGQFNISGSKGCCRLIRADVTISKSSINHSFLIISLSEYNSERLPLIIDY